AVIEGVGDPTIPEGDVVLVEGVSDGNVSEAELERTVLQLALGGELKKVPARGSAKFEELREKALEELINGIWLRGQSEELGISVPRSQVASELTQVKKTNFKTKKAFKAFLEKSHYTPEEVNEKIELGALSTKIQEQVQKEASAPTDSEVSNYYEAEKATQFTEKPSRDVRVVINEKKSEIEKAREALEADQSPAGWKKVAEKYSSDPTTSSKGGLQESISEEVLQGPLKKAIYGSARGELVGPTKYQGNYLLTEVVKVNQEKVKPLSEVKGQIGATLTQQKQSEHFEDFVASYRSRWTARTFCASGFQVEQCANYPASKRLAKAREAYKGCFEASPKEAPAECPAPVQQAKPALPGSVSLLKPKGEPLAQRPRPGSPAPAASAEVAPG
ncbi:MAG TPA: peptidyl-prolyl cis-trans isomerase, partial [Solirubrobacterales bacterium]|nr:peptidyl-prolyl cis-trans isomerase [Solirubrobacterales bacterium]